MVAVANDRECAWEKDNWHYLSKISIISHGTHSINPFSLCSLAWTSHSWSRERGTPEISLNLSFKFCMFAVPGRDTQYLVGNSGPVSAQSRVSKISICLNGCCGISRVMWLNGSEERTRLVCDYITIQYASYQITAYQTWLSPCYTEDKHIYSCTAHKSCRTQSYHYECKIVATPVKCQGRVEGKEWSK